METVNQEMQADQLLDPFGLAAQADNKPEEKKKRGRPAKEHFPRHKLGAAMAGDPVVYFKDYVQTPGSEIPLAFNPEYDHSELEFRKFRADEMPRLPKIGTAASGYWQIARRDTVILGHKLSDVFMGEGDPQCPWDSTGLYPFGDGINVGGGRECREMYLAVRPAAARDAEFSLRQDMTEQRHWTGADPKSGKTPSSISAVDPATGDQIMSSRVITADRQIVTSDRWPHGTIT